MNIFPRIVFQKKYQFYSIKIKIDFSIVNVQWTTIEQDIPQDIRANSNCL